MDLPSIGAKADVHASLEGAEGSTGELAFSDVAAGYKKLPKEVKQEMALGMPDWEARKYAWADPEVFRDHTPLNNKAIAAAQAIAVFDGLRRKLAGSPEKFKEAMKNLEPRLGSLEPKRFSAVVSATAGIRDEKTRGEVIEKLIPHWDRMDEEQRKELLSCIESIKDPQARSHVYIMLSNAPEKPVRDHEKLLTDVLDIVDPQARAKALGDMAAGDWPDMSDGVRVRLLAGAAAITDPTERSHVFPGLTLAWRYMNSQERNSVMSMLPDNEHPHRAYALSQFAAAWRGLEEPVRDDVLHASLSATLRPQDRANALQWLGAHMQDVSSQRQMLWARGVVELKPYMRSNVIRTSDASKMEGETRELLLEEAVPGTPDEEQLRNHLLHPIPST